MQPTTDIDRRRAPGALYVKRPADLVATEQRQTELLTAGIHQRWELRAAAVRLERRGEIKILRREVWNEDAGEWCMVVRRLKPATPAWRKRAIIGGVLAAVAGAVLWLGWLTATTLAAIPGAGLLVLVGACFVGYVVVLQRERTIGPRRRGVDVDVKVRVR